MTSRLQQLRRLGSKVELGEATEESLGDAKATLFPEYSEPAETDDGASGHPVGASESADRTPHWYQRPSAWLAIAVISLAASPIALLGAWLGWLIFPLTGLAVFGLWMAALTAKRPWTRILLKSTALVFVVLLVWAVWNYLGGSDIGSAGQARVWLVALGFWLVPFLITSILRRRLGIKANRQTQRRPADSSRSLPLVVADWSSDVPTSRSNDGIKPIPDAQPSVSLRTAQPVQ